MNDDKNDDKNDEDDEGRPQLKCLDFCFPWFLLPHLLGKIERGAITPWKVEWWDGQAPADGAKMCKLRGKISTQVFFMFEILTFEHAALLASELDCGQDSKKR